MAVPPYGPHYSRNDLSSIQKRLKGWKGNAVCLLCLAFLANDQKGGCFLKRRDSKKPRAGTHDSSSHWSCLLALAATFLVEYRVRRLNNPFVSSEVTVGGLSTANLHQWQNILVPLTNKDLTDILLAATSIFILETGKCLTHLDLLIGFKK